MFSRPKVTQIQVFLPPEAMPKVEIMSFQTQGQKVRDFVPAGGYVQGGKNTFQTQGWWWGPSPIPKLAFGPRSGMFFWRFWSEDWDLGLKLRASILTFRRASIGVQDTWYNPHGWREVLQKFCLGPRRKLCVWNISESCETQFISSNQAENKTLRSGPALWLRK